MPIGEIRQAVARGFRRTLKRGRSCSLTIGGRNPLATRVMDADQVRVKAYDDRSGVKQLRHFGPIVGIEKVTGGEERTLAITSADPSYLLQGRLIGRSTSGVTFGTSLVPQDRGDVMGDIIDALNTGSVPIGTLAGDTGIRLGSITPSAAGVFGPWRYVEASEAFSELAAGIDAPDWDFRPVEPVADSIGVQIAALDVAPAFGAFRPNMAFELGTGRRNVTEFRDVTDATLIANRVAHLPPGFPDGIAPGDAVVEAIDAAAIAARGLREAVVEQQDLTVKEFRQQLVDEHVRIRKQPRRVITFSPIRILEPNEIDPAERRVPRPFVDYDVGDVVPFRAIESIDVVDDAGTVIGQRQVKTVDALFRIFTIDISIDEQGAETVTLTFVEEG